SLSNDGKLGSFIDRSFLDTSRPYWLEIGQGFLDSLSYLFPQDHQAGNDQGGSTNPPALHANNQIIEHSILQESNLQRVNSQQRSLFPGNNQEEGERNIPVLHANNQDSEHNIHHQHNLQRVNSQQTSLFQGNQQEGERNPPVLHANNQNTGYNIY